MHTTMVMLGRVAIIGGTVLVCSPMSPCSRTLEGCLEAEKVAIYLRIYELGADHPCSISGVLLAEGARWRSATSDAAARK